MAETGLTEVFEQLQIYPDPEKVERRVAKLLAANRGKSRAKLARSLARATTWRITGAGVVASLPGAIPGLGTAAQLGIGAATVTGETWMMMRNLTTLQMQIAGLMGHDVSEMERRDELVIVWGLTTGAVTPIRKKAQQLGGKVAKAAVMKNIKGSTLRKINKKLGTTVLTKMGTKRGGIALGRVIPLGVGVAIGGGVNFVTARAFASKLVEFYTEVLPNGGEFSVEV